MADEGSLDSLDPAKMLFSLSRLYPKLDGCISSAADFTAAAFFSPPRAEPPPPPRVTRPNTCVLRKI